MQIGERLKEAREAKDLSLDYLQETTKIQKRYLVAIEEGNFNILPGTFYARAFIKEYALAVGLDPHTLLEEHKDEIPKTETEVEEQYSRMQRSRQQRHSTSRSPAVFSLIPRIIVILLIIGIIFVAWTLYQKDDGQNLDTGNEQENDAIIRNPKESSKASLDDEEEEEEEIDEDHEVIDDDSEAGDDDEIVFNTLEEGTGNVPESIVEVRNAEGDLTLTFETEERSWLAVTNEAGDTYYSQELSTADSPLTLEIDDANKIHLNIGNASQLNIQINGKPLPYPVSPSDHVHQKIWLHFQQ